MKRGLLKNLLALLLLLLASVACFGQAITASLQGRIADKSGAVVPKATVTVTNTETGFSRSATSGDTGEYTISSLPVGNYKVTTQAQSFQAQTRAITLTVGDTATLDFSLLPSLLTRLSSSLLVLQPIRSSSSRRSRIFP